MKTQLFERLFYPSSVAVIGASVSFGKWGQLILTNILGGGYPGQVFPINPKGGTMCGLPVYKNIVDVPQPVDLAFITTPAPTVPRVLEDCSKNGVKAVVIISSGFKETGEQGAVLEQEIARICSKHGILLIGPNTMGIISPYSKLFATGSHTRPRPGGVAFVSQSGNLGNQLVYWASQQGIGISQFVGSGNEAMVQCADYLQYLAHDTNARIIMLYMENVEDGRRFLDTLHRVNRDKPIIVLKGGKTAAGKKAAASHTGSMSGDKAIFDAVCTQARVLNVGVPSDLLDLSAGFSSLPLPKGNRVGIVTLGGGWGVVTADACNSMGLVLPHIPQHIIDTVGRYLPPFWSKSNPLDLVGTRDLEVPLVAVEELLKWDGVDAVISLGFVGRTELVSLLVESTRRVDPDMSQVFLEQIEKLSQDYERNYISTIVDLMETYEKPVIGVSLTRSEKGTVRPVEGKRYAGVFYQTPENAVNVLAKMAAYSRHVAMADRGGH